MPATASGCSVMERFPITGAAYDRRKASHDHRSHLGAQPTCDRPINESRAWKKAHARTENDRRAVEQAYATELLPTILGGEWIRSTKHLRVPSSKTRGWSHYLADEYYDTLFDHPLHYRRQGTKGALTLNNGVVIGQPYSLFHKEGSEVFNDATDAAIRYGVRVWARLDLSAHFPGRTALVIAARDLNPDDAAKFGFTVLNANTMMIAA